MKTYDETSQGMENNMNNPREYSCGGNPPVERVLRPRSRGWTIYPSCTRESVSANVRLSTFPKSGIKW